MADSVTKGQEFYEKAQKKLKSFSFFGKPVMRAFSCELHACPENCMTALSGC